MVLNSDEIKQLKKKRHISENGLKRIELFLRENKDKAYTNKELAEKLGYKVNSVIAMMSQLRAIGTSIETYRKGYELYYKIK